MEDKKEENKIDKFIDSSVDSIFSKDNGKWLIFIVFLGAILRFLMARNVSTLGDEMVHGPHAIGFLHSGLISTILESPLWFYLTDIVFKFLGVTMFSSRFLSFFYGVLSILVVYLISLKIFNKKIALISAFLLSISFFTIRYTLMEMDLAALFFLIFAVYLFLDSMEKKKFPLLAAVCIGIAALIKTLSLFFVPAFLIGFFLFNKNKSEIKNNIKNILFFGIIIILFFSPIFIHNYLWYKDKGQVDTYFAQYFFPEMREVYSGQAGYASGFLFNQLPEAWILLKSLFTLDPLIMIFGILGIISLFSLKEKRTFFYFLFAFQLSGLIFLLLSNHLQTHYTTIIPILCVFGGFFIDRLSCDFKKIDKKKVLAVIIILIFIFQAYLLSPYMTSRSGLSKMKDYANENMDKNSLVVADARIYRGQIAWLFYDFHYLEASYLSEILYADQNLQGEKVPTKVYFVECVHDDCGWGASQAFPINDSSEQIVKTFSSQVQPEKMIYGGGGYVEKKGEHWFNIYSIIVPLSPQIFNAVDSTHIWFYYPVNYLPKKDIFDNYDVYGAVDNLIYNFAWLVIISSIILSILLPIILFRKLLKKDNGCAVSSNPCL